MDILIDRVQQGDGVELVVRGRLDAESAGELRQAVSAEVRRGMHAIALDLTNVGFLSSAGIRVLFETQREARGAGGDCHVRVASEPVQKVLELTRLDRILMRPANESASPPPAAAATRPAARDLEARGVRLLQFESAPAEPLVGRIAGTAAALRGARSVPIRIPLGPQAFAFGIGSVAEYGTTTDTAGELLAACGGIYHRPPRPFTAVDYLIGTGDLVPEIDMLTGLSWQGLPEGRAGFEPAADTPAVSLADLVTALLDHSTADTLAVVIAGEVHGLVAAELIRPLAEATAGDHPLTGSQDVAARWLCFSREPVQAGRTAVIVGVVSRGPVGALVGMVAALDGRGTVAHLHAVVFPHRPLRRATGNLPAVVADLAASEPLAVLHLMTDDRPVLGSGVSELVRGSCWFAPVTIREGDA